MNVTGENPYESPLESPVGGSTSFLLRAALGTISFLSGTLLFFLVVFLGPFAWLLRDGLGPDSVDSGGLTAVGRMFWCFYWGPATAVIALVFALSVGLFYRVSSSAR